MRRLLEHTWFARAFEPHVEGSKKLIFAQIIVRRSLTELQNLHQALTEYLRSKYLGLLNSFQYRLNEQGSIFSEYLGLKWIGRNMPFFQCVYGTFKPSRIIRRVPGENHSIVRAYPFLPTL